jgi:bifunctional DNA-binding transcriptional regulator/antitoxin component of YhaV-PrlF toxin-antitoxin module
MRTANIRPVGPRNQVTLPKEAMNLFKIRPHDLVAFVCTKEGILMKPVTVVDKNVSFAEDDLDEIERSIHEQVKAGDFTEFSGSGKALNFLKGKK